MYNVMARGFCSPLSAVNDETAGIICNHWTISGLEIKMVIDPKWMRRWSIQSMVCSIEMKSIVEVIWSIHAMGIL